VLEPGAGSMARRTASSWLARRSRSALTDFSSDSSLLGSKGADVSNAMADKAGYL
jgi:hypothetical protein